MPSLRSRIAGFIAGERRGNPLDNPAIPLSEAAFLLDWGSGQSDAGVAVNEKTSMQLLSVYACVNVLQQDISTLPVVVYEETDKGRVPARQTDLHHLVAVEPNPEMSARTFYGAIMACLCLNGNAYARIQRQGGTPIALWPLHPSLVRPVRVANILKYEVAVDGGRVEIVEARDMLHFINLSVDGMVGMSPIRAAQRTIGTAIAAEKYGARWFGRGSRPSGVLVRALQQVTGTLPTQQAEKSDKVRDSWERAYGGDKQGGTAVLPPGWEWKPVGVPPEEAQFLETQGYTRTQIAALYRLLPHMIGDTSRLSNGNHESASLEYVKLTLRPLTAILDTELQRKLVPRTGQKAYKYTIEHDFTDMERGDFASQMTGIAVGRQWSVITTDEARIARGLNPVGPENGGDMLIAPLNMIPLKRLDDYVDSVTEPSGSVPAGSEPQPAGNGGQNQRMLLQRMARAFAPLFRDAVGRLVRRDKRDATTVEQIFGPTVDAISDEAGRQARELHRLDAECDLGADRIRRDALKAIEKRASNWTATTSSDEVAQELDRTVRSITLQTFREAAVAPFAA